MQELLSRIFQELTEKNNCDIWIDSYTRLLLFPVYPVPESKELPYMVGLFVSFYCSPKITRFRISVWRWTTFCVFFPTR